ncbi:FtsX-like permease family protein [Streptomyces endophytica]|uniref:FtsX-like permease family protein n=1 Tax=Streptomyces endophytica TaxID=2991496 RepID=A0ABY6PFQ1_9ACTN|nr:FtsX-like permease family protein [Streptomyces endophytica]UZJ32017.1 FtsX-like permease family protein [Streptomyces endophytica]
MPSGLARAALRGHRPAFAGTAVAALFAAAVVGASVTMLAATGADGVPVAARRTMAAHGVGDMALVLLLGSVYLSVFVVASTMGTAVAQQHREFAMLRAVGARPWQIRRAVAAQAVMAAVPAALAGCALGAVLARWWFDGMVARGLIPGTVAFRFSWVALPVCLAVAVVTSAVAGLLAAARFAGLRPARALAEAAAGRRGLGPLRLPLGLLATAGGVLLSRLLADQPAEKAGQGAFLVLLLFCAGVALLGPRLVGPAAWLLSRLVGRGGAAGLAMRNVTTQSRRFSAAVVPLVLVVAFGTTKIALHTTAEHRTGSAGPPDQVWLDYVGTGLYAGFAAIAAANTLAVITAERRRELALLRLIGSYRRQVRAMAAWEAAVVAGTALLLGTAIALLTLAPVLRRTFGAALPYVPWTTAAAIAGGTLLLALLATGVPVHLTLRRRATGTLAAA